jgi:hypothetical protein
MSKDLKLEDVLEGYAVDTPDGNDPATLRKWVTDHPEFADELLEFAAMRSRVMHMPDPVMSATEIEASMSRGRAALAMFRDTSKKKPVSIRSLTELASQHGLNKQGFAKAVGMSLSLIMYMEKRRLIAASVPDRIIKKTAEVLRTTKESVAEFLHGTPAAGSLSYKAESRPEEMQQKDFAEAVAEDQTLSDEQKRSLLE